MAVGLSNVIYRDRHPGRSEAESRDPGGSAVRWPWVPDRPAAVRDDETMSDALRSGTAPASRAVGRSFVIRMRLDVRVYPDAIWSRSSGTADLRERTSDAPAAEST